MQATQLLHNQFKKELPFVHQRRLQSLMDSSTALLRSMRLNLTALGRSMEGAAKVRSQIKKVDRLLGNTRLHGEINAFYAAMSKKILSDDSRPLLQVDWSCVSATTNLYVLRASLSMPGRAIVIYEEVHPKTHENNHRTHQEFLNNLKKQLPQTLSPVIVTDAGFRAPWFRAVSALGWDYVGRLRHKNKVLLDEEWQLSHCLYPIARQTPRHLGSILLTEKRKVACELVIYRGKKKNRHKRNLNQSISREGRSKRYSRAHKEPLLLVTSLKVGEKWTASEVVNIYKKRMEIEENFRDTKCARFGFGLRTSGTKTLQRMRVLLLIAAITTFVCWLAGKSVQQLGKAADYQAHSAKYCSVLSLVFLGREALRRPCFFSTQQFYAALEALRRMARAAQRVSTM